MSKVLIVEDSSMQRLMMADLLHDRGFGVISAANGFDALAHLERDLPDVAILDIAMQGISGFELCRRIKSRADTRAIRVILCSSTTTESSKYWGFKQGADAYVCKPFRPSELVATVAGFLPPQL